MGKFKKLNYIIRLILILILATMISVFISKAGIGKESIIMVFLVGVLTVNVVTTGYLYGAIASIMSVLFFNYLFTVPIHTFLIYNPNDITLLMFFFIASIISSSLTSRFQKQLIISKKNEHTACLLYKVTANFLNITGKKNIVMQGINYINDHTGYMSIVKLFNTDEIYKKSDEQECSYKNKLKKKIYGLKDPIGEIEILYNDKNLSLESELIIKTVITQMGIALDREFIYNERENIRIEMEREHLRSNLLRAISHDLRTPLTAIVGASGVVIENIKELDLDSIKKLVKDINEEALWLNNLVENILNMTRIGEGKLVIQKQYEVVDDIVNEALTHISGLINERNLEVSIPDEVVDLPMDGKLIVQVLINLLDNAIKHTQNNGTICLRVYVEGKFVIFEVENDGEDIKEEIKEKLFESFESFSGKVVDGKRGIGLGLAICKAIVNAHGGNISAENLVPKGVVFKFTLPLMEV